MTNKHMKSYSTPLVITGMQIKPQCDTATHTLKWIKVKRLTILSAAEGAESPKRAGGNMNWNNHFGKQSGYSAWSYPYTNHTTQQF